MKNLRMKVQAIAGAALLAGSVASAQAAFLDSPVPASAYITKGGLDWAWAHALPGADLTYQGTQGWRIPTPAELAQAPLATDFLKPGGNVPFNGTDPVSGAFFDYTNTAYVGPGACAAPYFSNDYRSCNWQDGLGQPLGPWAGLTGAPVNGDQLVVRSALVAAVPTLGSMGLVLLGLGVALAGVAAVGRRKAG